MAPLFLCKSVVEATAALLERAWQTENLFWVLGGKDPAKKEVCVAHICLCVFVVLESQVLRIFFSTAGEWDRAKSSGVELAVCGYLRVSLRDLCKGFGCLEGAEQYDTRFRDNKGQDFPPGNQFESRHAVVHTVLG